MPLVAENSNQSSGAILFPIYSKMQNESIITPVPGPSRDRIVGMVDEQYNYGMVIAGFKELSDEAISNVNALGKRICTQIKDAEIKVWLSLGIEGNWIVNPSGEAGLEVTFHCKK